MTGTVDRRTFLLGGLGAGGAALAACSEDRSKPSERGTTTTAFSAPAGARNEADIDGAWTRIETWLRKRAPAALAVLRPPAPAAAIDAAETSLGVALPEAFRQSLARHDGQEDDWPSLIGYGVLLPLDAMVEKKRSNEEFGLTGSPDDWWRPGWVPFVSSDGDSVSLDLGSANEAPGQVWSFLHYQTPNHSPIAPDYTAWLTRWADELEAGVFKMDFSGGAGMLPREFKESRLGIA